jgi:hypothetical protein
MEFFLSSFHIFGLEISSLSTLALNFPNQSIHMVFKGFMVRMVPFLLDAVFHIINLILSWDMYVQNNDMSPAISQYSARYSLTADKMSFRTENSTPFMILVPFVYKM